VTGVAYHPTIEAGRVVETDPGMGASVVRGSEVTLLLSEGPEPLPLVNFRGMSEDEARAAIEGKWTLVEPHELQFTSKVAEGDVIAALRPDGERLPAEGTYGHQQPLTLLVSAGTVPDVRGLTVDEATATLEGVDLTGAVVEEQYSETVEAGRVLTMSFEGAVRPGDEIALVVSAGPAPVEIPALKGLTREEAEAQLTELGLTVSYNPIFTPFPAAVVADSDPQAGEVVPKGSNVTLYLELFG
jgi:serine/threonine-protein kinase